MVYMRACTFFPLMPYGSIQQLHVEIKCEQN